MTYKIDTWTTKWGKKLKGVYRDGKNDWNTNQSILLEDEYCFNTLPFNKKHITIDIGSHIGAAAIALASLGVQVIAIEPLIDNIKMINETIKLNNFESNIKVYHAAIGKNDNDKVKIYHGNTLNEGGFVHEFIGNAYPVQDAHANPEIAQTISLDTIFKKNNIEKCSIVKIDCEGGEWPCFLGASSETLNKIQYIVGETHTIERSTPTSRQDFFNILQGKFKDITKEIWPDALDKNKTSLCQNFIFKKI